MKERGETQRFSPFSFSRQDEAMALAKHENEDTFIAAQLQQTLADLDEDLEGRKVCVTSEARKTETRPVDAKSSCTLGTSCVFLTEIVRSSS